MNRLVYAYENGKALPMLLHSDNSLGYIFQFKYVGPFRLGDIEYFEEHYLDKATNTTFKRVLAINRFCQPTLRLDGTIYYIEVTEIVPYPPQVYSNLAVYHVGTHVNAYPWLMDNWIQHTTPRYQPPPASSMIMLPADQWHATQNHLHITQQQQAIAAQETFAIAQQMREQLAQAQQEIEALRASLNKQAITVESVAETAVKNEVEDAAEKLQDMQPFTNVATNESTSEELEHEEETAQEACKAPEVIVDGPQFVKKTKAQLKEERKANFKLQIQEFLKLANDTSVRLDSVVSICNAFKDLLNSKDCFDLFIAEIASLPAKTCVDILSKKSVHNKVKEALLYRLLDYPIDELISLPKNQFFINLANQVSNNQELIAAIKKLQPKLIKPVEKVAAEPVVDLKQQLQKAVAELNTCLLIETITVKPELKAEARKLFMHNISKYPKQQYSGIKGFIELLDIASAQILQVVRDADKSVIARLACMARLKALPAQEFYIQNSHRKFQELYGSLSQQANITDLELEVMLQDKVAQSEVWATEKVQEIFTQFATPGLAKKIDFSLVLKFANQTDAQGYSMLMHMLRLGFNADKISEALDQVDAAILSVDPQNQTVWHYLAKYYRAEWNPLVQKIRDLYESAAQKHGKNLFAEVNRQEITSGNTYLHFFLQHKTEEPVVEALKILHAEGKFKITPNPFHATVMLPNSARESSSVLLDKKKAAWLGTQLHLYSNLGKVIQYLYKSDDATFNKFLPDDVNFFYVNYPAENIMRWLEHKDIVRLFNVLESRIRLYLQTTIITAAALPIETEQEPDPRTIRLIRYFEMPFIETIRYKDKSVFSHITDYLCATVDLKLQAAFAVSSLLEVNGEFIRVSDTLPWKLATKYLNSPARTPAQIESVNELLKSSLKSDEQTLEFMAAAVDEENYALLAYAITFKEDDCRSRFADAIARILVGCNKFAALKGIISRLHIAQLVDFVILLFNNAAHKNKLEFIKYMVEKCGIIPTDTNVILSLSVVNPDNTGPIAYMLDKFESHCTANPKTSNDFSLKIFAAAAITNGCDVKINFLIQRGYNPNLISSKGESILEFLLKMAVARVKIPGDNAIDKLYFVINTLFAHSPSSKQLITLKNVVNGLYPINYLVDLTALAKDDHEALIALFEIFFENGAKLDQLNDGKQFNPFDYAIEQNSMAIVELFADNLSKQEIIRYLNEEESGMSLVDIAFLKAKLGTLDAEIASELQSIKDEAMPKSSLGSLLFGV